MASPPGDSRRPRQDQAALDARRGEYFDKVYAVVGYGTFITRRLFETAENVEPALVRGFRRVLPPGNPFPFVLRDPDHAGFWALKFEVDLPRLFELDAYEGLDSGLYYRRKIPVLLRSGREVFAYIYVPTARTVREYRLDPDVDPDDAWKDHIARHLDIVDLFPELLSNPAPANR
ncbi:MAG: gamma-glutamylcyclotransferase family protein [Promethearchaeota archaeon]